MELPVGRCGKPVPVSGVWYYGILKESPAVKAGANIIKHLTHPTEELFKVNRTIGLPVRKDLYGSTHKPLEVRCNIPYRETFIQLASAPPEYWNTINKDCPIFYRPRIENYIKVSPLLLGMMVAAAREATAPKFEAWIWQRPANAALFGDLRNQLQGIVNHTASTYKALL